MLSKLPSKVLTPRGWGLVIFGAAALLLAEVLGRRDVLALGIFLVLLPLLGAAALRLLKPRFSIERTFRPPAIETSATTTVRLSVRRAGSLGGVLALEEQLPVRFGQAPAFTYPSRATDRSGESLYEYRLRSSRRGLYSIGPVLAEFTDPFGLSRQRHDLGRIDQLTVTPAPVPLPETRISGGRGTDGSSATRAQANPSNDDVMTREYRHGDPLRRVHWAATARAGELMVRQEESVTAPQATLLLDEREASYGSSAFTALTDSSAGRDQLRTTANFEWAVTAVASVAFHLLDRSYSVRVIDAFGAPALRRSPSSQSPEEEEFDGGGGFSSLAEGLAALELDAERMKDGPVRAPFDDMLLNKLAVHRMRGPLIAITGALSAEEAKALAPAAEFGSGAFAMLVVDHPQEARPMLDILQAAGWRAIAVNSKSKLTAAWSYFDAEDTSSVAAAAATTGSRP